MKHEDYNEMLIAYALDALDAAEARALEAHLETCQECGAELDDWRETASLLAYAAPTKEPSAHLRTSILEGARALHQTEQKPLTGRKGAQARRDSSDASRNVLPFAEGRGRRRWRTSSLVGALAACVLFTALVVGLFVLWTRNQRMQDQLSSITSRLKQAEQELAREREEKEMLASPEARTAMLAGTEMAPMARARITFDSRSGRAMLSADGLPPAPEGKAYQLWFIAGGHVMPGGVFRPDAEGRVLANDQVPEDARTANVFAVTLEPQTGMQSPTGDKYLLSASPSS